MLDLQQLHKSGYCRDRCRWGVEYGNIFFFDRGVGTFPVGDIQRDRVVPCRGGDVDRMLYRAVGAITECPQPACRCISRSVVERDTQRGVAGCR